MNFSIVPRFWRGEDLILFVHFLEMLELSSLTEERTEVEEEIEPGGEDEQVEENRDERSGGIRVQRKCPMELLVMCAPAVHVTCLLYPGLYFVSLDLPMLLISIVPKESRNFFTTSLCLAWETLSLTVFMACEVYTIFTIVSFVLTLTDTVDLVIHQLSIR